MNNPPKFWLLLTAIVGIVVLMALNRVSAEAGIPVITFAAGYGTGNGVAAKKGDKVEPIFGPKDPPA